MAENVTILWRDRWITLSLPVDPMPLSVDVLRRMLEMELTYAFMELMAVEAEETNG